MYLRLNKSRYGLLESSPSLQSYAGEVEGCVTSLGQTYQKIEDKVNTIDCPSSMLVFRWDR